MTGMMKRCLLVMSCLILIASCAPKKIVSTQPREPRQKAYQKPYTVLGKRYEPLQTSAGFVQTGIASWYGPDFHGKKTSNGETYDMRAMTAAHKTLPLGVYVRVQNRENGREAVVRVNDRGPFVKDRIIDLSYSAAKTLGVDIAGTAAVRIEALGFRGSSADHYDALENYDVGNYTVQIGSFKDLSNAERLSGEMRRRVGFSEIRTTNVKGEIFHRVYAGKFTSLKAAEEAEREFSGHGYPGSFSVSLD